MSAASSVDPRVVVARKMISTLYPNIDPNQLKTIAALVAEQTKAISDVATDLQTLIAQTEDLRELVTRGLPSSQRELLQSTISEFRQEQARILSAANVTPEETVDDDLAGKIDKQASEAMLRSIEKAKILQKKSCKACAISSESVGTVLQRCSRCKDVLYCSVACQKRDWPRHKKAECLTMPK